MNGKWSCVSKVDSNQFANCPMTEDGEFHIETDLNPSAARRKDHWKWVGAGYIPDQHKIQKFYYDHDCDTIEDDWVCKEVIMGACVDRKGSGSYTGWSIVLRTVIRWEEQRNRINNNHINSKRYINNRKPSDVVAWEDKHGKRIARSHRRAVRRRIARNRRNMARSSRVAC